MYTYTYTYGRAAQAAGAHDQHAALQDALLPLVADT